MPALYATSPSLAGREGLAIRGFPRNADLLIFGPGTFRREPLKLAPGTPRVLVAEASSGQSLDFS